MMVLFSFFCLFCFISGPGPYLIWIMGHSFAFWGERRAGIRPAGRQLGFSPQEAQVRWLGTRGMRWTQLLTQIHFYANLDRAPDVLLLHVGGNDLGVRTTRDILRDIKLDCLRLWASYPGILIVWSDIVARKSWRRARSVHGMNRARVKLNKAVGRFVARNGGIVVRHRELEEWDDTLLRPDGVHP